MRRLLFSPRWLLWHVLTLGAMATCGALAVWQWQKAGSAMGSALNVGYGLQWPVFALFFGFLWWRMLRAEVRRLRSDAAESPEPVRPDVREPEEPEPSRQAAASPFTRRPVARAEADDDPVRAEYNRMLAELALRDRDD